MALKAILLRRRTRDALLSAEAFVNLVAAIAQGLYGEVSPARPLSMFFGLGPAHIPVVAARSEVGGFTTEGVREGFNSVCRGLMDVPNKMNASAIFQIMRYKAINSAANTPCTILIIVPEDDNLCSLWAAADVGDKASNGETLRIPQAGHFDIYPNSSHRGDSISSHLQFLRGAVPV